MKFENSIRNEKNAVNVPASIWKEWDVALESFDIFLGKILYVQAILKHGMYDTVIISIREKIKSEKKSGRCDRVQSEIQPSKLHLLCEVLILD